MAAHKIGCRIKVNDTWFVKEYNIPFVFIGMNIEGRKIEEVNYSSVEKRYIVILSPLEIVDGYHKLAYSLQLEGWTRLGY